MTQGAYYYEFFGGPKDGEIMAHPELLREFMIHLAEPIHWASAEPSDTAPTRVGIYRVRREERRFGENVVNHVQSVGYKIALYWEGT